MPGMDDYDLRVLRCNEERYAGCPHCGGPVNVELPLLRYANRLATMVDAAIEHGGAEALPQIKAQVHDFMLETNGLIEAAEMEDPYYGGMVKMGDDLFQQGRRAKAGVPPQ